MQVKATTAQPGQLTVEAINGVIHQAFVSVHPAALLPNRQP